MQEVRPYARGVLFKIEGAGVKRALVIAAHPDDEWFSIGGTLMTLTAEFEYVINIVMVTDGERGDGSGPDRLKASDTLCDEQFKTHIAKLNIPANGVYDFYAELVDRLDVIMGEYRPHLILTHFGEDTHQDHRTVSEIVLSSARVVPKASILLFESPSSVNFTPNFFVDISRHFAKKLSTYYRHFKDEVEHRPRFNANAVRSIAKYWGQKISVPHAEAFRIVRWIL